MKKTFPELKQIPGWTVLTGVRTYCQSCGHLRDFQQVIYWKKDGERSLLRCEGCALEASKA